MSHIPRPMEASDAGSHVKPSPRDPFPNFNLKTVPYENSINLKWKGDNLNFKIRVLTMGGGIGNFPLFAIGALAGAIIGGIAGGVNSYLNGDFSWSSVGKGAAIGALAGATLGVGGPMQSQGVQLRVSLN